jgi:PBSX family phage terminase large subunit
MRFNVISPKQAEIFKFMAEPYDALICDGAVRSGKTTMMTIAFIEWLMANFAGDSFGICGKTVRSAERNIIAPLLSTSSMRKKYGLSYSRSTSILTIRRGTKTNYCHVFGGKDEGSYMLIQGITLCGVLFDEVALMPQSFVDQAIARTLSIDDAKLWFNCNPENPNHWFYKEWVQKPTEHNAKHLHFLMNDNPSLSEKALAKAKASFTGVFYDRYVRGLWVAADGMIYQVFANNREQYQTDKAQDIMELNIGVDFGGGKSGHAFVATAITRSYNKLIVLASERYLREDQRTEIDPDKLGELFVEFCQGIIERYGMIHHVYCDSAEQTLIAGLRTTARKSGLGWLLIENALKTSINDRIRATLRLMAQGRFFYVPRYCETLDAALSGAVWNPKNLTDDERLDDGTSDIDTLDAFEYTFERHISQLIRSER